MPRSAEPRRHNTVKRIQQFAVAAVVQQGVGAFASAQFDKAAIVTHERPPQNLFNTNTGDARRGAEVVDNQLPGGQAVDQVQPVEQRLPARGCYPLVVICTLSVALCAAV